MVPVTFHQPPGGRTQPPSATSTVRAWTSPSTCPPRVTSCLPAAPGGLRQVTPPPQTSVATSGLAGTGVLATRMSCEFGTSRSDHRDLGAAGDVALRPPVESSLEAPPGLDSASTPTAAVGRDQSQPTQPSIWWKKTKGKWEPLPGRWGLGPPRRGWAQGPQHGAFSRVAISGERASA